MELKSNGEERKAKKRSRAGWRRAKGGAVLTAQLRMVKNRPPFSPRTPEQCKTWRLLEPDGVLAYKRRPVLEAYGVLACKRRTVFEADGVLACKRRPVLKAYRVLARKRRTVLEPDGVLACKRRPVLEPDGVLACKRRPVWEPDGVRGQKGDAVGTIPRCAAKKAACFSPFRAAR